MTGKTPSSRVKRRLIESAAAIEETDAEAVTYQHTIFCQTALPYRNLGAGLREWERRQGNISLKVNAGAFCKGWPFCTASWSQGPVGALFL